MHMTTRYRNAQGPPVAPLPDWPGDDRRRAGRVGSVIRAMVRSAAATDCIPVRARAVDISEHGAKLLLRRRFEVGDRVSIDLECELPLRVHLGFAADSLVIDGPMHTHLVRLEARVVRSRRASERLWDVGVEFCSETPVNDRHVVNGYVEHLRDNEAWAI
jgi:c-di-GMP-binding flagellar brake protein YcgR